MGFVIKAQNDWRNVGQRQVAMPRNCPFRSYHLISWFSNKPMSFW